MWGCLLPRKLEGTCASLQKTASSLFAVDTELTRFHVRARFKGQVAEMEVRGSVSSEYQLSDQDTDGELEPMSVRVLFDNLCMSTELVEEFEASLTTGLSEAVAAIQTLLKFIRNCEGVCVCVFYGHTWISIYTYVCLITVFHVCCMM